MSHITLNPVVPEVAAPTKRLRECELNGFTNKVCGHAVVVCDAAMDRFEGYRGWDCPRCNIAPRIGVYNVELSCDEGRTLIPGLVCQECHDAHCTGACCAHIVVEEDEYGKEVVFWPNLEENEDGEEDAQPDTATAVDDDADSAAPDTATAV